MSESLRHEHAAMDRASEVMTTEQFKRYKAIWDPQMERMREQRKNMVGQTG